jgi:hypothetical protein
MKDFTTGPASGSGGDGAGFGGGGAPPTVLLAAMGAAVLIAATLVGFLIGSGGGSSTPSGLDDGLTPAVTADRVLLTIEVSGGGSGRVHIDPLGISCTETCEHGFATGSRVTLRPDADTGSHFDGWSDACSGDGSCSIVMDRTRSATAAFESKPASVSQCEDGRDNDHDGFLDEADPGCDSGDTEAPNNRPAPASPASECSDGRDNDGDGLVDAAQDPGCESGGTEADDATPPTATTTPAPPPPPPPPSECSDGRDNDGDGLIDRAQDPGCATGDTEGGTPKLSECRDGRDNDGDGRVDRPADPGCDADGTEAGG